MFSCFSTLVFVEDLWGQLAKTTAAFRLPRTSDRNTVADDKFHSAVSTRPAAVDGLYIFISSILYCVCDMDRVN